MAPAGASYAADFIAAGVRRVNCALAFLRWTIKSFAESTLGRLPKSCAVIVLRKCGLRVKSTPCAEGF